MDLFRLVCYLKSSKDFRQVAWVGDPLSQVWFREFADADLVSDPRTNRSTSASNLKVWGPNTCANQSMGCRRQTAVSHSTPEAEIVSAGLALRTELLPSIPMWETLLNRAPM